MYVMLEIIAVNELVKVKRSEIFQSWTRPDISYEFVTTNGCSYCVVVVVNGKKIFLFSKGTVENGPKHFTTLLFCWQEAAGRRYGLQQTERETPVTLCWAKLRPVGRGDIWIGGHPWPGVRLALVVINHASLIYLYYKCFVCVEFQ